MSTLPIASISPHVLSETILTMTMKRGSDKSICPSEVARLLVGDHPDQWGQLMIPIRRVAVDLMKQGRLLITRKGEIVDPDNFKGVYRLTCPRID